MDKYYSRTCPTSSPIRTNKQKLACSHKKWTVLTSLKTIKETLSTVSTEYPYKWPITFSLWFFFYLFIYSASYYLSFLFLSSLKDIACSLYVQLQCRCHGLWLCKMPVTSHPCHFQVRTCVFFHVSIHTLLGLGSDAILRRDDVSEIDV